MEAGMPTSVAAAGCEVTTAGWEGMMVSAAGWVGMAVSAAGWPVTTPSELVCCRYEVWGKGSTEDCAAVSIVR